MKIFKQFNYAPLKYVYPPLKYVYPPLKYVYINFYYRKWLPKVLHQLFTIKVTIQK